jgi:hypothetical protein
MILSGERLSPLGTAATVALLYPPQMIDDGDWQGKPKYSEKTCLSATLSTTDPTFPYDLTRARSRAAGVGSRRLTAWAMARPSGGRDPYILDLGTIWRWVVSFTPRSLYPRGNSPLYPLIFSTRTYLLILIFQKNPNGVDRCLPSSSSRRPCSQILWYWPQIRPLPLPSTFFTIHNLESSYNSAL